ncbi:hypothetical protein A0256_04400 [Mucilaginibacter sp. PAMC 26640]|nr:hypothetical protein A0256_04400 [Mucilaginibacter sp. PAMC 26640]
MIGNKCFLDTSVVIDFFRGNAAVVNTIKSFDSVYISDIAVGELYYGAYVSLNHTKHINQIVSFLESCTITAVNTATAILYGEIKADLKRRGKPIPENDIWIAAVSLANNLPLFTTDKHFELIGLQLVQIIQ